MSDALHQIVRRALLLEGVAELSPDKAAGQKMAMLLYMARLLPRIYRDRNDAQKIISFATRTTVPMPINGMSPEADKSYTTLLSDFGDPVKDNIRSLVKMSKAFIKVNAGRYNSGRPVKWTKWHARAMDMSSDYVDRRAFPNEVAEALFKGGVTTSPDGMPGRKRTKQAGKLLRNAELTDFYTACLHVMDETDEELAVVNKMKKLIDLILELDDLLVKSLDADQRSEGPWSGGSLEEQVYESSISESVYDDIFDMEEPSAQGVSIDTVKVSDEDAGEEENSPLDEAREALQLLEEEIQEIRGISYWEEINDLIIDIREEFTSVEDLLSGAAGGV